jgi:hypothetical protein
MLTHVLPVLLRERDATHLSDAQRLHTQIAPVQRGGR